MTTETKALNVNDLLDTKLSSIGREVIKTEGLAIPLDDLNVTVQSIAEHITAIKEAALSQEGFDIQGHMNVLKGTLAANPSILEGLHEESLGEIVSTLRHIHRDALIKEAPKKATRAKRSANASAKADEKILATVNVNELEL